MGIDEVGAKWLHLEIIISFRMLTTILNYDQTAPTLETDSFHTGQYHCNPN